ncbi:hypothetical protein SAMN02787118_16411 [Streptomyces mirabilis]|jgi:alkylhydroperoxidase family enzyme|uniref:Uncharacterized protein n=1 Tax=Streptomyces mirabilis TaxID=68239 RepID=A0A1I2YBV9_9ACTN|nr:hypothetical protein SAMN02787118_16411 [Streptomyces mirabilis]
MTLANRVEVRTRRTGAHRGRHPIRRRPPGVSDETWTRVREHYDDDQIAALVSLIALINATTGST